MTITFNPSNLIQNSVFSSEIDFVNKYGNYSIGYNDLTPLGTQKKTWFYFVLFLSLILTIILFVLAKEEKDINGNVIEPTTAKKLFKILAYGCLGIFIISVIYSGYMYFFIYSPQYNQWFKTLPVEAQNQLNIITSINVIANQAQNYSINNPLIKIN